MGAKFKTWTRPVTPFNLAAGIEFYLDCAERPRLHHGGACNADPLAHTSVRLIIVCVLMHQIPPKRTSYWNAPPSVNEASSVCSLGSSADVTYFPRQGGFWVRKRLRSSRFGGFFACCQKVTRYRMTSRGFFGIYLGLGL